MNTLDNNEKNIITVAQVAAMTEKKWVVCDYKNGANGGTTYVAIAQDKAGKNYIAKIAR